jgi:alpha-glucosidase
VESYEAALPGGAWPNWVLGNHDKSRVATRLGQTQARLAQMLLLTLRGTPTLYYGDELGMADVKIPPELARDPQGKDAPGFGRDPGRTPMQWDVSPNAGFSAPGVTTWLPLAANYAKVNVDAEKDDPASLLTFVRQLLALRGEYPALNSGSYRSVASSAACYVYERAEAGKRLLVALNFSDQPQTVAISEAEAGTGQGRVLVSTHAGREGVVDLSGLKLGAAEGVVLEL